MFVVAEQDVSSFEKIIRTFKMSTLNSIDTNHELSECIRSENTRAIIQLELSNVRCVFVYDCISESLVLSAKRHEISLRS